MQEPEVGRGKRRKSFRSWNELRVMWLSSAPRTYPDRWFMEDGRLFLTNIDAVIFHGFRSTLQHEVRYPLAEALDSLLAFFLTLSDHGREDR